MYVQVVICCELVLSFYAERTKCLSLVCCWRPSCCHWVPCPQDGGPSLWLWWWRSHSLALCSLFWSVVHGGVPREILWIWCEGHWQGWPALLTACLMCVLHPLWTHLLHGHSRHGHLYLSCVNLFMCIINMTPLLLFAHVRTYTSWCGTLLVDILVPSDSIVSPSLHMQWGCTPLLRAAQEGHEGVARFLLEGGSSVQEQDNVGWAKGVFSSVII